MQSCSHDTIHHAAIKTGKIHNRWTLTIAADTLLWNIPFLLQFIEPNIFSNWIWHLLNHKSIKISLCKYCLILIHLIKGKTCEIELQNSHKLTIFVQNSHIICLILAQCQHYISFLHRLSLLLWGYSVTAISPHVIDSTHPSTCFCKTSNLKIIFQK